MSPNVGVEYTPSNISRSHFEVTEQSLLVHDIQFIRVQFTDLINNVRYHVLPRSYFLRICASSRPAISIAAAILGLVGLRLAPIATASGEYLIVLDLSSLRIAPYAPGHATVMAWYQKRQPSSCGDVVVPLCPRTLLKRITDDAEKKAGVRFLVGFESEFTLLKETSPVPIAINDADYARSSKLPSGSVEAAVLEEIAQTLLTAQIELQKYHAEAAPGQYEVITGPLTPLEAADALIFTRETIYNVASKYGVRATFAPRLFKHSAGSAAHTHISVHTSTPVARPKNSFALTLSTIEQSFLQGVLSHVPALCAITLPTTASYGRVADGVWSGGTYVSWGYENREAPVRLCGSDDDPRFEIRFIDGTASPYLMLAGVLGAGVLGIIERVPLASGNCIKSVAEMNGGEREQLGLQNAARLPLTIADARRNLDQDRDLRRILGEEFVDMYLLVNKTLEEHLKADTEEATAVKLAEFY